MGEESQEEMLARVRAAQKKVQDKVDLKDKVKKRLHLVFIRKEER